MNIHRRQALATFAATWAVGPALAQSGFPQRPVHLIVPNAPGGPSDVVARALSAPLGSALGQTIVVENRPGASGLIGTGAVVNAPADGYTLLVTSRSNNVLAPLVQKSTSFDPARDLAPVAFALRAVGIFATNSQTKLRTMRDFIAYAKAHPGAMNFGSAGIGSTNHIAIEQFKSVVGVDLAHVPYKGSGPLIAGLIGNEVQFAVIDFSSAQAGMRAGTLVALAQTGQRRLSTASDIPTLTEAGVRDFDSSFWIGIAAPRNTPADVVARLNKAIDAALGDIRVKAYAQANGWELVGGPPKALGDQIAEDLREFPPLLKRLDIRAS